VGCERPCLSSADSVAKRLHVEVMGEKAREVIGTPDGPSVQTKPVLEEAAAPELREWEWTEGGGLKGRVYGRDGFRPGHKLATSRIVEFSSASGEARGQRGDEAGARLRHFQLLAAESAATLCEGALVVTKSLSLYRLGAPRPAAAPAAPVAWAPVPAAMSSAAAVPPAAPASTADQPPPMVPVVSEAEGYQLTLSARNRTGYLNVSARARSGTFAVQPQLSCHRNGKETRGFVDGFATAKAAVIWFAKYTAGEDPPMPHGGNLGAGGHYSTPPQPQAAVQAAAAAPTAARTTFSADGTVAREVEATRSSSRARTRRAT